MKRFASIVCTLVVLLTSFPVYASSRYEGKEENDLAYIAKNITTGTIIDTIRFDCLSEESRCKVEREYLTSVSNSGLVIYVIDKNVLKVEILTYEKETGYSITTAMIADEELSGINTNEIFVTDKLLLAESQTALNWINNSSRSGVSTSYSAYTIYAKIILSEATVIPYYTYVRPYRGEAWMIYNGSSTPSITDFRVNTKVRGTLMDVNGTDIAGDYTWITLVRASAASSGTVYSTVNYLYSNEMIEMYRFPESCFGATGSLYENGNYKPFNVFF